MAGLHRHDLNDEFFTTIAAKMNLKLSSWKQIKLDASIGVTCNILDLNHNDNGKLCGIYGFELAGYPLNDTATADEKDEVHGKEMQVLKVALKVRETGYNLCEMASKYFAQHGEDFVKLFKKYYDIGWGVYDSHTLEVRVMQW